MIGRLPLIPDQVAEGGICMRPSQLPLWTSTDRAERHEARALCMQCPARAVCLEWSLNLPKSDISVYGGMFPGGRTRLRRARAATLAASP